MLRKIIRKYQWLFWNHEKFGRHAGVRIGKNCDIQTKQFGSEPYLIEIGDHVQIVEEVRFFTHGGEWVFRDKYPDFDAFGRIRIGNNVFIGFAAIIMPGVTIGNNVIIGAGSVVTRSIPDNVVAVGNPARIVRPIDDQENKLMIYNVKSKKMSRKAKKEYLLSLDEAFFIKK